MSALYVHRMISIGIRNLQIVMERAAHLLPSHQAFHQPWGDPRARAPDRSRICINSKSIFFLRKKWKQMLSYLQVQGSFPGYMKGILLRRSLRSKPTSIFGGSSSSSSSPSSPSPPSSLPSSPSSTGSTGLGVGSFFLRREVKSNKGLAGKKWKDGEGKNIGWNMFLHLCDCQFMSVSQSVTFTRLNPKGESSKIETPPDWSFPFGRSNLLSRLVVKCPPELSSGI